MTYAESKPILYKLAQDYGFTFIDGHDIAPDWVCNRHGDVVTFHSFRGIESFVCWKQGREVRGIPQDRIYEFLSGMSNEEYYALPPNPHLTPYLHGYLGARSSGG